MTSPQEREAPVHPPAKFEVSPTKETEKTIYIIHPEDLQEEGDVRDLIPEVPED